MDGKMNKTMDCDSLTKTGSCAASTIGSSITSLAGVLSISCLAMKLANSWPYHSKRFLSIISLQHFTLIYVISRLPFLPSPSQGL